jgi:MFS family permease
MMAHFAHHLVMALPTPLLPAIRREFGLSYTQSSFVTSAFALAGGAGQLPSGWLADRVGPMILIMVGILGVAVAGVLVGLSHTYVMLILCLILMGLLSGGYHPAATPLISASVEPNQRGRVLGFHLIGGNSSFFVAPLVAGAIAAVWGWRGAFLTLAVPTAVFGLIFYFYLVRRGGKAYAQEAKQRSAEEAPPPKGNVRRLVAFLTMTVLGGGAAMSVNAFLTLYMVDKLGATEQTAASLMSILYFSGLWAGPVGGYISDRVGTTKVIIVTGLASGLLIFGLKSATMGFGFYAILFLIGLTAALRMPPTEVFIMSQAAAKHRSTIYGVYYFTMQYTGAIFAPLMGQVIDHWGFDYCFNIAAIAVTAVTLLCSPFIWDAKG